MPSSHWDAIAARSFHIVFLMGVWRRSPLGRLIAVDNAGLNAEYNRVLPGWTPSDVPGSPYCIKDYVPDDRMGGWEGLDEARRQLAARGVGLILDFVPNHTAFDHPWVAAHPERYVLGSPEDHRAAPAHFRAIETDTGPRFVACGRDPYFDPWTDVAQLNYFNPETRAAMIATLAEITQHCDGVRCDMAMLVLNDVFDRTWRRLLRDRWPVPDREFWPATRQAGTKAVLLAEAYWSLEGRLLDDGFDFVYGKELLDGLHHGDAHKVRHALGNARADRFAWFLENHDEPRSAGTLAPRLAASAAIVATAPGMRFFYDGQFEGSRVRGPVQLGRWPDERTDAQIADLYNRVLQYSSDPVFTEGDWSLPSIHPAGDDSHHQIVAIGWKHNDEVALTVANIAGWTCQAHIDVSAAMPGGDAFYFEDALTSNAYRWTRESLQQRGLYVRLDAGAAHLFRVRPAS